MPSPNEHPALNGRQISYKRPSPFNKKKRRILEEFCPLRKIYLPDTIMLLISA